MTEWLFYLGTYDVLYRMMEHQTIAFYANNCILTSELIWTLDV